jgi:AcrR family transcriptional regulator
MDSNVGTKSNPGRREDRSLFPRRREVESRVKNLDLIGRRRKQIIDGAIKIFVAKGFQSATVREITEAAGLTMGSLYNYVRSKEDIIYIVYDYITGILRDEMRTAISGIDDPEERLKAAFRHNLDSVQANQDIILFLYTQSASLDKRSLSTVLARETDYIEMFDGLLSDYFKSLGKRVNKDRIRIAADLLSYIPVILALRRWSLKRRYPSMESVLRDILDFTMRGIEFVPATERKAKKGKGGRPCRSQAKRN